MEADLFGLFVKCGFNPRMSRLRGVRPREHQQLGDARKQLSHRPAIPPMVEITQTTRRLTWSVSIDRGDDVELDSEYAEDILRLTAAPCCTRWAAYRTAVLVR
jgi:hypothetical protein